MRNDEQHRWVIAQGWKNDVQIDAFMVITSRNDRGMAPLTENQWADWLAKKK